MSHLGGGVDELELDGLHRRSRRLLKERLSERDRALLGTHHAAFDHDEVIFDETIVDKSTDRVDRLVSDVDGGGGVVSHLFAVNRVVSGADAVHLLVDLGSVVVTLLTRSGYREGDTRWMPRSNTRHLAETLVSLARQLLGMPSRGNSVVTATLGDT